MLAQSVVGAHNSAWHPPISLPVRYRGTPIRRLSLLRAQVALDHFHSAHTLSAVQ